MENSELTETVHKNRGALFALALSILLPALGTSIGNIALPTLSIEFSAPFHQIQWVSIAYLAAMALGAVFAGRLGDSFGHRKMLLAGLCAFCAACALAGVAPELWVLIGARGMQGISAAFLVTLAIAMIRETVGDARIGRTMGLMGSLGAIGMALGPSLGGVLIATFGWPSIFAVLFGLAILAIALVWAYLPASKPRPRSKQAKLSSLLNGDLLRSLFANLLVATVMMSTLLIGPFFLGFSLGLQEAMIGLVMSVGPCISIASGVPSGRIVDRLGAQPVLIIGLVLMAAGAFSLAVFPMLIGLTGYILAIAVLTPGYQIFLAANNTLVMVAATKNQRGATSGLLQLSRNIGLIAGASVMGVVFTFGVGTEAVENASSSAINNGMGLTFLVAGGLVLIALSISIRPISRSERSRR